MTHFSEADRAQLLLVPEVADNYVGSGVPVFADYENFAPHNQRGDSVFDLLDDKPDVDAAKVGFLRRQSHRVARHAPMDLGDGIEL